MVSEKADSSRSQALKTAVTEYFSAEQTNDVENQPHKVRLCRCYRNQAPRN